MTSPGTVAIIGASNDRRKYGNKAVRAYVAAGWRVVPVHPAETSVEGIPAVAGLGDLDLQPDCVALYVPPAVGVALLPAIAARGTRKLWVNRGAESAELMHAAERLQLPVTYGCAIRSLGLSPQQFPDT